MKNDILDLKNCKYFAKIYKIRFKTEKMPDSMAE